MGRVVDRQPAYLSVLYRRAPAPGSYPSQAASERVRTCESYATKHCQAPADRRAPILRDPW